MPPDCNYGWFSYCFIKMTKRTRKKSVQRVAKFSTNWNNGLTSGTFYLNLNNASSNRNRNISRHLVHTLFITAVVEQKSATAVLPLCN